MSQLNPSLLVIFVLITYINVHCKILSSYDNEQWLKVSHAGKNADSASKTSGVLRAGLEKVWYPGILVTSQCQI